MTDPEALAAVVNTVTEPVIGWFSLSLIISCLAQAKGRDGGGWWILGLLLGPLALFLVTIADKVVEKKIVTP